MAAWQWRKLVEQGEVDAARGNGSIVMMDQKGVEVARWNFLRAWPTKISGPSLNSSTNEVGVEELEIAHEGLERVR
jgi:phage tail-like protein